MAFLVNTSVDFSTAVGYTFNGAEFGISGGVGTLDLGVAGPTTCVCPSINTAAWTFLNRVEITETVADSYRHRYLVSFDGGTTYYRYSQGNWIEAAIASIATVGMLRPQVEQIRNWTLLSTGLVFAVSASRTDVADLGEISGFAVYYLTGSTPEPVDVTGGEPYANPTEALEDVLLPEEEPEMPLSPQYSWPFVDAPFGGNYQMRIAHASRYRVSFEAAMVAASETRRDAIVAFLQDHAEAPFWWLLCPLEAAAAFTASEPQYSQIGVDVWRVTATFTQAFVDGTGNSGLDAGIPPRYWFFAAPGGDT